MHEISWRINKINIRNGNEKKFQASLFGINLDTPVENSTDKEVEIDDETMNRAIAEAHRRRLNG